MDIKEIEEKEPALTAIFNEAISVKSLSYSEKHYYWYKKLKPRMLKLVGFSSKNDELTSTEIYDKVYFHCLDLMGMRLE